MQKYLIFLFSICASVIIGQNSDTIITSSKINKVTVFFSGAQISRQVEFKAIKGQQLLLIDNLPVEVKKQSMQLGEIKNAKTLSVKLEKGSSRNPKYSKEKEILENQKKEIEKNIKYIITEKGVYDSEEIFIIQNRELAGDKGVTIAQISEGANFYRSKLKEIRNKKLELDFELEDFKDQLLELDKKMQKLTTDQRKTSTQLYVLIDSKIPDPSSKFEISYYLETAAWEPVYDFRVQEVGTPLSIDYKANIYQTTGEDWEKVNLILSTGDPSLSSTKPILEEWYLDKSKKKTSQIPLPEVRNAILKGRLLDSESKEPIPFANVVLEIDGTQIGGTNSDFDGNYTIRPVPSGVFELKASSIGFKPVLIEKVIISEGKITYLDVEMDASSLSLDEVMVVAYETPLISKDRTTTGATVSFDDMARMPNRNASSISTTVGGVYSSDYERGNIRGARSQESVSYIDGMNGYENQGIINSNYMIEETAKNMSDIEYEIKEPYTVLSDGKDYNLKIKESKVPVDYVYFAIPKLDNDAFLTARIANWNELDLLSGKSSIYYQGTYIGESNVDDELTSDTLDLSLGRDRDIVVTRKGNKEKLERKVLGKSIKETLSWDIEIKNNKNESIKMILEDQFPLAENNNIEIELLEISGAKAYEKTGKLCWELELDANSKKTVQLTYSIKYPSYTKLYFE